MFVNVYQRGNMFRIYCRVRKFRWYVYIYFQIFKKFYVYGCFAYLFVWAPLACLVPTENKRCQISWNSKPTCGCWESNAGPLEGQPALLTDEPTSILLYQKPLLSRCAYSRLSSQIMWKLAFRLACILSMQFCKQPLISFWASIQTQDDSCALLCP